MRRERRATLGHRCELLQDALNLTERGNALAREIQRMNCRTKEMNFIGIYRGCIGERSRIDRDYLEFVSARFAKICYEQD